MRVAIFNNFANYANRVERKLETYADYIIAVGAGNSFGPFDKINFKNRDGITTSQVVNLPKGTENFKPNYLLVLKENSDDIVSRWFVTEAYESRAYQYNLSLVRDIIADNWDTVLDTPSVVSRGWARLGSGTNSPIFNSEGFSLSQVKTNEYLLKDKTGSAWIVGYIQKNDPDATEDREITFYSDKGEPESEPEVVRAMFDGTDTEGYAYDRNYESMVTTVNFAMSQSFNALRIENDTAKFDFSPVNYTEPTSDASVRFIRDYLQVRGEIASSVTNHLSESDLGTKLAQSFARKELTDNHPWLDEVQQYIGRKFYDPLGRGYILNQWMIPSTVYFKTSATDIDWWEDTMGALMNASVDRTNATVKEPFGQFIEDGVELNIARYIFIRQYVNVSEQKVKITTNHAALLDRPWDMCAMPLDSILVSGEQNQTWATLGRSFAAALTEQLGENCLDVQLLPFCPMQDFIKNNGIDISNRVEHVDYEWVKSGNDHTSILLWARKSSGRLSIPFTQYTVPDNSVEFKVDQETKVFRLCAPNYASAWEFSPTRNKGLSSFDVDFTYEPLSSYVRLAPHFGGLYGKNFGDSRGLIISCDMSLPKISDNWTNYKLQNANYQKIFDRQVGTMTASAIVNGVQSLASLGLGVAGAAVGINGAQQAYQMGADKIERQFGNMIVGNSDAANNARLAKQNAYGDLADTYNLQRNQAMLGVGGLAVQGINEIGNMAMDIVNIVNTKEVQKAQIANIKAQPQTITQIGAFNINNKLFPVLEIYDATESEKENVREFIKYRSMNIGRTATIRDYLSDNERTWIEAALLDTFAYAGDSHELTYLAQELAKGVFIYV